MAVAKSNSGRQPSTSPCNRYKVTNLAEAILESSQTSNLKDRYILGERLGWGQFGIIRKCSDKFTREVLACKSIAKDRLVTPEDVRSVKLEIEIMTRLSGHPNVVDLKAVYEEEDYVHLVMELCAGGELFDQLEKHGRFSETEARILFRQLMQVVMFCHDNGVVHRDLKPENILLATRASSSPIKLADFGLATYIKPGQSLQGTVGSPFYIAPEVLAGGYNQAADVWSAGVILYILLSGVPPFWGKTKSRIFDAVRAADLWFPSDPWDQLSESAKDLIAEMLQRDPSKRLTAEKVLDHPWIRDPVQLPMELCPCEDKFSGELHLGLNKFSTSLMDRSQDISFGTRTPSACDAHSPSFTCRTSFSSFVAEPSTSCLETRGFSFHGDGEQNGLEFSPPILSMPSFAFFSAATNTIADPGIEPLTFGANISTVNTDDEEASLERLLMLSGASLCMEARGMGPKGADFKRTGGTSSSRMLGVHSKRNHTIGLGELEQLDLMVTESVIRWASCTNLPTAPSLRSSLVC